ncbi:MAG: DUF5668 domain-containing protein [Blautia sp.]|nr:DUF5668 domain-containing protein [Blautia sp.]MCM1200671.1 DUF5668 domain-containing protein [Bacteroides fragilis]
MKETGNGKITGAQETACTGRPEGEAAGRTHRVGTVTCGIVLILYGVLFLIRMVLPALDYQMIFDCWPVVLIFLGVEILIGCIGKNAEKRKFQYDFGSVLIIMLMMLFAMLMAAVDYGMWYEGYYYGF